MMERIRRPRDPLAAAEAVFKTPAKRPSEPPAKTATVPGAKQLVSIRLDQEVVEYFQAEGLGWQDRINAILRLAMDEAKAGDASA